MMFSDRFINVLATDADPMTAPPPASFAAALGQAIANAPAGPCTLYIGRSATLDQSYTIDARFEVLWAPGAVLTLTDDVVLTVVGEADLDARHHFTTAAGARVRLLGPLRAIHPEWWGADADHGLESARLLAVDRILAECLQVPIRLLGSYALNRTFMLHGGGATGGAAEVAVSFIIEGRFPRGDQWIAATFRYANPAIAEFPLVELRVNTAVVIRAVGFDGLGLRGRSSPTLRIEPPTVDSLRSQIALERCSFFVDQWSAINVGDTGGDARSVVNAPEIELRDCWFQSDASDPNSLVVVQTSRGGVVQIRVDGCSFVGPSKAMIAVPHGVCTVTDSDFSNRADDDVDPGTDILLGHDAETMRDLSPFGHVDGLASIQETHVRTHSRRHLKGECGARYLGQSVVTLTGVVQESYAPAVALDSRPSVVVWRSASNPGPLIQGCFFEGSVEVYGGGSVFDVGNTLLGSPPLAGQAVWQHPRRPES